MADLFLHDTPVESIFHLLGEKENDITYSVGWALSRSPSFLRAFLKLTMAWNAHFTTKHAIVRLQTHEAGKGFTDIEIDLPGEGFIIVEAKKGWNLPSRNQLGKYTKRRSSSIERAKPSAIVVLSECNSRYSKEHLDLPSHSKTPILSYAWKDLFVCAMQSKSGSSHAEKRLLNELTNYLESIMSMQNSESNLVYVVALGSTSRTPKDWRISFRDLVNEKRRYFHAFGRNGWPSEPPNYIAFRYHGRLQTIHHIESYQIFTDPHEVIKEIPTHKWKQHIMYRLGPSIRPSREVRTGKIFPNGRVWCMLDTLLTSNTISEARDLSKKRRRKL